ncbi:S8 family serine peptidase [Algoriphagus sp. SE2]|uniref:S8 family serine peptidase n=1 Tax=Algoriphagus sp. SE2 TaxID=3141536 RepID=UPI0031CCF748
MRLLITLCFLALSFSTFSQSALTKDQRLKNARKATELKLRSSLSNFTYVPNSIDESKFSFLNAEGGMVMEDGFFSKIQYLDETGWPIINQTNSNVEAAITTGANQLQPDGTLGVDLTGKGLTVGIFDQTRPKADHVEFGGRLTQVDGSTETLSTHSTHVSGTLIGAGINASARGMAYEATAWAFNWDNDVSKMISNAYDPESKVNGTLLSNHSYSIVLGWQGDSWNGNPSISTEEDWRFGFYSSMSAAMDQAMFSRPYYLPVFAAGNNRSDRGDGTRPPDGPSDILGPRAVSKNGLTIGAVERVLDYQGPQSVVMSSFSSWGPTDDGRIKPDLVAMGVNVFSASINSNGEDAYASQSGTSMAAPNVTGSLFLLQQLYSERNAGRFMLSSSVKALAIHTAKEAGPATGPDYMNGWGLLDVAAGAQIILDEDGSSKIIREDILGENEDFEFEFVSDGVTPIKATLVWTDPEGDPPATDLDPTDIMLINDLDIRIFDEDGTEYFPWTLDPSLQASARGINTEDNFRDNVEKIEINSPKAQRYRLVITHKDELEFGLQQYSLVFTAGTIDGVEETLYWIGGTSGNWNDGNNWSFSSKGLAANKFPGEGTRVVFEGSAGGNVKVNFPANASAFSLNLFGNQVVDFDLKGNQIQISNGLRVSNQISTFSNGLINFANSGNTQQIIEMGQASFSQTELIFSTGSWRIIDADQLDVMSVSNATVAFEISEVGLNSFSLLGTGKIEGMLDEVSFLKDFSIASNGSIPEGLDLIFEGTSGAFTNASTSKISSLKVEEGSLEIQSGGFESLMISNAEAAIMLDELVIKSLELGPSSVLDLGDSNELIIQQTITSSATSEMKALITANSKGKITHDIYLKYCFDQVDVSNVDFAGDAIINLGTSSTVLNSSGWLQQNCEDVLFAKFETAFTCAGAAVTFDNLSEGSITTYSWDFGSLGTSTLENPVFVFDNPGTYVVKLRVANTNGFTEFEQPVVIGENTLQQPNIVVNGSTLTSQQPGTSYQWYQNGAVIAGATSRSYEASDDGIYQVAIFNGECNRISEPVVISAIPDQEVELSRFGIFIGPNPFESNLNITINNEYKGPIQLRVFDMTGRDLVLKEVNKIYTEMGLNLNLIGSKGIYILQIETNDLTLHKKLIKK